MSSGLSAGRFCCNWARRKGKSTLFKTKRAGSWVANAAINSSVISSILKTTPVHWGETSRPCLAKMFCISFISAYI